MLTDIINAWNEGKGNCMATVKAYTCNYCSKSYSKESTLLTHICEPKRRAQQEKEIGVQLGLQSYLKFYEISQGLTRNRTYQDFAESSFYTAFVKFGRHLVAIRAVNPKEFIEYVIKQNKKLDQWCHETVYSEYLTQYMRTEAVQDAMERALKEMEKYAEDHPELKNGFCEYFRFGHPNRICYHIVNGRISPWVVFNCETGIAFLESLNEEQLNMIIQVIDPDFWKRKFKDHKADTEWVKSILKAANL
jgi:hypothetical protein